MAETKIDRQIHNLQLVKKKQKEYFSVGLHSAQTKYLLKKAQKYKDKQTNEYVPGARMSGREHNIFV